MSDAPRILAFGGSLRAGSFNQKLVRVAARGAEAAGAVVTVVELRAFPMPLFDQDIESSAGAPGPATRLKALMKEADGFLIASPEYNGSVTAAHKNAIDWTSRPAEGEPPLAAFKGKAAVLMSASPGALGGLRGLVHLRAILGGIGVHVHPDQVAVPGAAGAFGPDGDLTDEAMRGRILALGRSAAHLAARLRA